MTDAAPGRCPALRDRFFWYEKLLARGGTAGVITVGTAGIWMVNPAAAIGYLVFAAVAGGLVVCDLLCAYCPYPYQQSDCLFLPYPCISRVVDRRTGPISPVRRGALIAVTAGLVAVPQYWLWGNWPWLAAFWLLAVPLGLAFPLHLCRRCRHAQCIAKRFVMAPPGGPRETGSS